MSHLRSFNSCFSQRLCRRLHGNLARLCGGSLRNADGQQAVSALRGCFLGIEILRKRNRSGKAPELALASMVTAWLRMIVWPPLSGQGQTVARDRETDLLGFEPGHLGSNHEAVVRSEDIDRRKHMRAAV